MVVISSSTGNELLKVWWFLIVAVFIGVRTMRWGCGIGSGGSHRGGGGFVAAGPMAVGSSSAGVLAWFIFGIFLIVCSVLGETFTFWVKHSIISSCWIDCITVLTFYLCILLFLWTLKMHTWNIKLNDSK